jgi:NAD(P)-dependent dehydrogenase (short-subunit alcohol dehydrogenase family)
MQCNEDLSVVIAGGASGLGAGTISHLAAMGCKMACLDLPNPAVARDYAENGVQFIGCDITDVDALDQAIGEVIEHCGIPQVVVNCAGIAPAERAVNREGAHDAALFARVISVNLTGSFLVASRFAAHMVTSEPRIDNERGVIINTASVAAYDGQVGQCAYAASKAGIAGLTLPLARDLSSLGIRVCAIAPGIFETPMVTGMPQEVQDSLAAQVPFPTRLGTPDDYATLVQHIIENRMLNGEIIRLDGAIRMGAK